MYMNELLPGARRAGRRPPAVRPRRRAHEVMRGPRLREARAGAGRADQHHRRRPGGRHRQPRVHDEPARGVRGRRGHPARRGARRRGDGADPRAGRGRRAAALRGAASASPRPCCCSIAGPDWDPQRTAAAIADGDRATSKPPTAPFDLILFGNESADSGGFQVGIRVARALGRPIVNGIKGIAVEGDTLRCPP